ncbi:hypothetical protein [Planktotalea sp.]|uniref:hypothetical protein n=1 Tax=Planktotalea sp. TaxID=2029877 RepID=UPI003D6A5DAD
MSTFFANVPMWVYPLFVLLVILGLRASKDRTVPIILVLALPLLGILTLRNIVSLSPAAWVWLVAAAAYALGIGFGMVWQRGWILLKAKGSIQVKGEWITMLAMMVIFCAGFANGALSALLPEVSQSSMFAACFAVVTCVPAGQFLGRAITTLRAPLSSPA